MGVLGLPNVGKSSLFNLLTEQAVAAENYPFCTIDPNESRCAVPDLRYDWLCDVWQSPSKIPAYLHITDIAGLIKGASEGAGLGNAFLSHIQAVDGLYHVVRAFDNPEVVHVEDTVDPIRDMETIMYELCRKDTAYVDSCKKKKDDEMRKNPKDKLPPVYFTVMEKVCDMLSKNIPLRTDDRWIRTAWWSISTLSSPIAPYSSTASHSPIRTAKNAYCKHASRPMKPARSPRTPVVFTCRLPITLI